MGASSSKRINQNVINQERVNQEVINKDRTSKWRKHINAFKAEKQKQKKKIRLWRGRRLIVYLKI